MKLKRDYLTHTIDDMPYLVPVGERTDTELIRGNKTTGFLLELLREGTDEEALVDAMCRKYDAPRQTVAADVREVLETLREVGALEE
jgi:Coenzyme PQQ synthesis protein D (PqqD).